uniref:Variant surface glycoprotein 405 n=1 Tax=Trypanosoma brucei TaxID=5691 RepID=M4TD63_9TRYP|nr:variant surface glycoprotein 405 [Trypanosoma brucei]
MKPRGGAALVAVLACLNLKPANSAANDAHDAYRALCSAVRVARAALTANYAEVQDDEDYNEILNMNMSVSPSDWQKLFDTDGEAGDWAQMKAKLQAKDKNINWENQWAQWRQTRKLTKGASEAPGWLKEHPMTLGPQAREAAAPRIAAIASAANLAYNKLKEKPTFDGEDAAEAVKTNAKKALCGDAPTYAYSDATAKCTEPAGQTAKNTLCSTALNGNGLATDIMCICADQSDNACGAGPAHAQISANNVPHTYVNKYTDACGTTNTLPTAAAVTNALQEVTTRLHTLGASAKIGLGITDGTECTDSNGDNCVDYSAKITDHSKGYDQVPWIKYMLKVHHAIQALEESKAAKATLLSTIANLKAAAETEYKGHNTRKLASTTTVSAQPQTATNADKQKTCEAIEKATDCKKNGSCKWEGDDKDGPHCKLNTTAAEQQTTQAGTGAAAPATGCAKHGTKTDCENDKTGDKQNCAWRKGKDNEPDLDKEMCRNGSFLTNKQFALSMVSAAFVALLF